MTETWLLGGAIHGDDLSHAHVALMAIRLLLRDEQFQHLLMTGGGGGGRGDDTSLAVEIGDAPVAVLRQLLANLVAVHFSSSTPSVGGQSVGGPGAHSTDLLKEVTSEYNNMHHLICTT